MYRELFILGVLIILAAAAFFIAERALAPTPEDPAVGSNGAGETNERAGGTPGDAGEFTTALEATVVAEIGQPIEGFFPQMFLETYSGLEPEDFDGVDAIIGTYVYENGELRHELDNGEPVHSAAGAISEEGYSTLYENVRERIDVDPNADVRTVLDAIDGGESFEEQGGGQEERASVTCTEEMKQADFCTQEYAPVCGLVEVQCVTEPCDPVPETFSNGCTACSQGNVLSYTPGACET